MTPDDWQHRADSLAGASVAAGDPTGWFEELWSEGRSGSVTMPWDSGRPHPLLAEWTAPDRSPAASRAIVVGCGLGADAEFVADLGYSTLAFDVSPTAIQLAVARHPDTTVDYRTGDLFALDPEWRRSYDLVVDIFTVQALPRTVRTKAIAAVADLVASGGTLLIVMAELAADDDPAAGPPWPLTRAEVDRFADVGLSPVSIEAIPYPDRPDRRRWRAEFRRPAPVEPTGSA